MADLEFSAAVAARNLEVAFTVRSGEVLAVVGPNGAGKSTTASVIAGLLAGDRALVRVGDRTLTDTARGVFVPAYQRRVGLLLQDPLLFPHMSVLGNVTFAAARGSGARTDARRCAMGWLERVGAADWAARKPGELSGGQAQRVALARAVAANPDVLVLDEPLAGLDVAAAAAVRNELRSVLTDGDRAGVLITHDLLDVLGLADRVVVLEDGRVAESGRVTDVLAAPRSRFGARLAGVNVVRGVMDQDAVLRSGSIRWQGVPAEPLCLGSEAVAVFAPAAVAVYRERPHGSPRNSTEMRIVGFDLAGSVVRVRAVAAIEESTAISADITAEAVVELGMSVGDRVWFTVKAQEVKLHAATRARTQHR